MSEKDRIAYKWNIERLEEIRVQHEMNPNLLATKQAYINALEYELNAATAEANKRIAELESEVDKLSNVDFPLIGKMMNRITELKASNNHLREALLQASRHLDLLQPNSTACKIVSKALSATPAESLQAHSSLSMSEKHAKIVEELKGK